MHTHTHMYLSMNVFGKYMHTYMHLHTGHHTTHTTKSQTQENHHAEKFKRRTSQIKQSKP